MQSQWEWGLGLLANTFDVVGGFAGLALVLRFAVFDLARIWMRYFSREVSITLNSFRKVGKGILLCIRTEDEKSLREVLGDNRFAIRAFLKNAKLSNGEMVVLKLDEAEMRRMVMNEVVNRISIISGGDFVRNEILGKHPEKEFLIVVGVQREQRFRWLPGIQTTKVRIHLILRETWDSLISPEGSCRPWENETDEPQYQERTRFLQSLVPHYRAWSAGEPGTECLAFGTVMLARSE